MSPSVLSSLPGLCSHRSHSQSDITHMLLNTPVQEVCIIQHTLGMAGPPRVSEQSRYVPGSLHIDIVNKVPASPLGIWDSLCSIVFICHTVSLAAQALGTDSSHPNTHVLSGMMGLEPGTESLLGREMGDCPPCWLGHPSWLPSWSCITGAGVGGNPDVVFRPDRQTIDRNRLPLSVSPYRCGASKEMGF